MKTLRAIGTNGLLIAASIGIGYVLSNLAFLVLIRHGNQANGMSRSLLSHLPAPIRWSYPTLGTTRTNQDIALIGDSYVEGAGDAYRNGEHDYSIGHILHSQSKLPLTSFGTNGTTFISQKQLYSHSLNGAFWPLKDGRKQAHWPGKSLVFIYEGNDFDNHIQEKTSGGAQAHIDALKSSRRFQPLRLFLTSKLRPMPSQAPSKPTNAKETKATINRVCGSNYCKELQPMQAASPTLSEQELKASIHEMADSIGTLKSDLKTNTCVVYIPSPGTIYSPDELIFQQDQLPSGTPTSGTISGKVNRQRSSGIRDALSSALNKHQIHMIDATSALTAAAKKQFLHGIIDQKHFNHQGNAVLAKTIVDDFSRCFPNP